MQNDYKRKKRVQVNVEAVGPLDVLAGDGGALNQETIWDIPVETGD